MSFFGQQQTTGTTPQKLTTLSVQTSSYGICMGMAWGTSRVTGNLIWYGDFQAIEHTQEVGGKGGGGTSSTNYTYRTGFALGLVESRLASIGQVWSGKDKTDCGALGLDVFVGAAGQSPWAYLTANHAGEALNYPDLSYVAASAFDLGNNASLPNLAFEIKTLTAGAGGGLDAAPWTIVSDMLSAGGFPAGRLGDLSAYTNWTGASGLFLSPALTEQKRAADAVQEILDITHTAAVASEGVLKLIPYGDTAAVGNGYTFTPSTAPAFDLTDDDFLGLDGDLPIRIKRRAQSDAKNRLVVEFKDRAKEYAANTAPASDEAHIAEFGERPAETVTYDAIKTASVASAVAYLKLQRGLYVLNTYEFRLGWRYCRLEPMDVVTLTHGLLGMVRVPVRITDIEEDTEGTLTITAEDFPQGAGQAPVVPPQPPSGYSVDMNIAPGNAAAPVLFEPPVSLAGQPEIWLATSGGESYGGCAVWVSLDNVTYQQVGVLSGKSRHGVTTAALPLVADPDTTSTLAVDLSVSGGALLGGTADDRDLFNTLCWVGGELVSYQAAALTGVNRYGLTSLRRGAYGTPITAHALGSRVVRCDERVFRYAYDPALIGKTLYVKLQAFNLFGGAFQDLASLTPTAYAVLGAPLGTVAGLALEQAFTGTACAVKWNAYPGAASYTVEVWSGGVKRRTVAGVGSTRYAYAFEDAKADGGPYRSLEFRVYAVAANGTSGSPAVLAATNPQVGGATGISTAAAGASLVVSTNRPADTDYSGTRVWVSATSGFNPSVTTPVYDGPDTWYAAMGLSAGTYYVRVAHYDVFGKDSMTTSGEISVAVTGALGVRSVTSLPANPAAVNGDLAVFLDTGTAAQRGLWGWDGTAWKNTRDGANLVAASVAADRLAVSQLSAITANLGAMTSGSITLDAAGFIRGGSTGYMTGTGIWAGYHSGVYKLHVGNPTGAGFTWDGTVFTIRGADGSVLLASGSGVPYAKVSGVPTSLSGINATEATKLSGIQAGATVGADASNLNVGMGGNLLPNTEFGGGIVAPVALGWNLAGCTFTPLRGDDAWRPASAQCLEIQQGARNGNQYNIGADVHVNGPYGFRASGIPVIPGKRYEFSGKLAAHRADSGLWIHFFDANDVVVPGGAGTGWVTRSSGGRDLSVWTHAAIFAVAPAGAVYAAAYWRKSDTDAGQTTSFAWLCQPYFGEATVAQTVPSTYTPGVGRGAFANLSKITAGNASTYIESAAIGSAQIADAAIDSAKIVSAAVGSAQIADAAIGTAKIGDAQVSTLKIAGEAVTVPRFAESYASVAKTSTGTWTTVLSLPPMPAAGSPVVVLAGVPSGTAHRLLKNGTPIFTFPAMTYQDSYIDGNGVGQTATVAIDSQRIPCVFFDPSPGESVVYSIQAYLQSTFGNGTYSGYRFIYTMGTKR